MKYFTFNQNNSGGKFEGPAIFVVIEAKNHDHANMLAELIGLYFNGCAVGKDCHCCGDRWNSAWPDDGDDAPMIYRQKFREFQTDSSMQKLYERSGVPLKMLFDSNGEEKK